MSKTAALDRWHEYQKGGRDSSKIFVSAFTPDEQFILHSHIDESEVPRHHPLLIQVIEELGEDANGACAQLKIVEIPSDADYMIDEYDGFEHIAEKHRTW